MHLRGDLKEIRELFIQIYEEMDLFLKSKANEKTYKEKNVCISNTKKSVRKYKIRRHII